MERKELMAKADELGVEFKKNISNADLEDLVVVAEQEAQVEAKAKAIEAKTKDLPKEVVVKESIGQTKARKRKESLRLVRCIVSSMDKDKAELQGEIHGVGSSYTGFIKKFIPFGQEWHVPVIILDVLKQKKMLSTKDRKTPKGVVKETIEVPAYNIVELPPLTTEELADLKDNL